MSMGQIFHLLSVISYILSALAFALAVFLFFKYRMIEAINILSGRKLKQDMDRLSHLSGASSEEAANNANAVGPNSIKDNKRKKVRQSETETLYGFGQKDLSKEKEYCNTEELYNTEATEEFDQAGTTEELYMDSNDTDELDIIVTDASDTELL